MDRKKWYELVDESTAHWDRKDGQTLNLFFSGYETREFHDSMERLRKAGGKYVDHRFDSHSGKTVLTIREPALTE